MTEPSTFRIAPRDAAGADHGVRAGALAAAYQPRREWAALLSVGWNLLWVGAFVFSGWAERLQEGIAGLSDPPRATIEYPLYLAILFVAHALLNYPLELWYGYFEERQFGLAKQGIRAWTRDWFAGVVQHGVMFLVGGMLILVCQSLMPQGWLWAVAGVLFVLMVVTSYLAADLVPVGLFHFRAADEPTLRRIRHLLGDERAARLPPVVIFGAAELREFTGGLVGLANRQALLLSESTIAHASSGLLRFVLLHELGHRRGHHLFIGTLIGWLWTAGGFFVAAEVLPPEHVGRPVAIAWLALLITAWMAIGEPVLAYLGRRFEYRADRYYLRAGGTLPEMSAALEELSRRNLERTGWQPRRRTLWHPLPSVNNRLHKAERYLERIGRL